MYTRNDIESLKDILVKTRSIFCGGDDYAIKTHGKLYDDALSTFSAIGKKKIYELSSVVYEFLECKDQVLKETAITTLGLSSRLHLPEFKEIAYKIWLNDEDSNTKRAALKAWSSYYIGTKNPEILKILYEILINEENDIDHRRTAMEEIFFVSQEPSNFYDPFNSKHFYFVESHDELNKKIDWTEIQTIMKKYAPKALLK